MHPYLLETELVRFAFVLGIVVSVLLYDRLHVSTGSVVVPGYLGICVLAPSAILGTLASSLLVYFLVHRFLPRFVLMTKTGKFLAGIVASVALQATVFELRLLPHLPWSGTLLMGGIGYVIPGLIAHDMGRQSIRRTLKALAISGAIVCVVVLVAVLVVPGLSRPGSPGPSAVLSYDIRWMPFAMFCSAIASVALRKHGLRAGGFLGAAYLSMIVVQPLQVASFVVLTLLTYLIVTRVLMRSLILFGRRKFASMLLVGTILSWGALLLMRFSGVFDGTAATSVSLTLAGVVLSGLFANDLERLGPVRLLEGTLLSGLFTLFATLVVAEATGQGRLDVVAAYAFVSLVSAVVIFVPRTWWRTSRLRPGTVIRIGSGLASGAPLSRGQALRTSFVVAAGLMIALAAGVVLKAWKMEAALMRRSPSSQVAPEPALGQVATCVVNVPPHSSGAKTPISPDAPGSHFAGSAPEVRR